MKFYQLTNQQRIDYLIDQKIISEEQANFLKSDAPLGQDIADSLSENQLATFGLPYGVATDFVVNGKEYFVPMSIEEPSVIAAASNGASRVKKNGGFTAETTQHVVYGQIVLESASDEKLMILKTKQVEIKRLAQQARPSLVKRGGGVVSVDFKVVDDCIEVLLGVDTVDAMGANIVNTMLEAIAPSISDWIDSDVLCCILSNSGVSQKVVVEARLKFVDIQTAQMDGRTVAQRIVKLAEFAKHSRMRAVTHNKGIMNGIDAVLLATGNDFRAEEAAAHSFYGDYQPFSSWQIQDDELIGRLELPIVIGTVGGAIKAMQMAQLSLAIMKIENSQELQAVIGSVGLANNLSALRALVTTGLQKGHMSLQSKSLAVSAGAKGSEIESISQKLNESKTYTLEAAHAFLEKLREN